MPPEELRSEDLAEPAGDKWETAAEEVAQAAALTFERVESVTAILVDQWRKRPVLMTVLLAAGAGIVFGAIVAGDPARRALISGKPSRGAMGGVAARMASGLTRPRAALVGDWPPAGRNGAAHQALSRITRRRGRLPAGYLMDLLPVAVALAKNPLVRRVAWSLATRGLRRR